MTRRLAVCDSKLTCFARQRQTRQVPPRGTLLIHDVVVIGVHHAYNSHKLQYAMPLVQVQQGEPKSDHICGRIFCCLQPVLLVV